MSLHCDDCTFGQYIVYWLVYYSWHWIFIWIYAGWWEDSKIYYYLFLECLASAVSWLERKGYLSSKKDARCFFIQYSILLALEPVEGYWILTEWYRTWLPGWTIKAPGLHDIQLTRSRYD